MRIASNNHYKTSCRAQKKPGRSSFTAYKERCKSEAGSGVRLQNSRTFACAHFSLILFPRARLQLHADHQTNCLHLLNCLLQLEKWLRRHGPSSTSSLTMETDSSHQQGTERAVRCLQKQTEVSQCLLLSDHSPNKGHFPELLVKLACVNWLWDHCLGEEEAKESEWKCSFSLKICSQSKAW